MATVFDPDSIELARADEDGIAERSARHVRSEEEARIRRSRSVVEAEVITGDKWLPAGSHPELDVLDVRIAGGAAHDALYAHDMELRARRHRLREAD